MIALFVIALLVAAAFFGLAFMDQRKLYWKTRAWQYRNPEAMEPSDAALGLNRAALFVIAVLFLVIAGIFRAADTADDYSTGEVKIVADALADRMDRGSAADFRASFGSIADVREAVRAESDGKVKVRSAGGEEYELTNRRSENPVCLTVTLDAHPTLTGTEPWLNSITTEVDPGPC